MAKIKLGTDSYSALSWILLEVAKWLEKPFCISVEQTTLRGVHMKEI